MWFIGLYRPRAEGRFFSAALAVAAALVFMGCAPVVENRLDSHTATARDAYPPEGRLLTVNGRTVHAHVQGNGPDVILLHGASGNLRDFTFDLSDRLARSYRVVAFDRPGLGWSDDLEGRASVDPANQARVLRAAAQQLGVRNPVVLGHSYGAAVALAWALEAPQDTRGLVLVSGATMPWPGGLGFWYTLTASRIGGATIVPLLAATINPERAEALVARIFAPQPVPPGYVDHIGVELALRPKQIRTNSRQVNGLNDALERMREQYSTLALGVELIHGDADHIVPIDVHAEQLSKILPNARLTRLEGVGHMPHHSNPEAVIAGIDRLMRR
jgi:pimeloyl-ACP methyl ester carboxylesterase